MRNEIIRFGLSVSLGLGSVACGNEAGRTNVPEASIQLADRLESHNTPLRAERLDAYSGLVEDFIETYSTAENPELLRLVGIVKNRLHPVELTDDVKGYKSINGEQGSIGFFVFLDKDKELGIPRFSSTAESAGNAVYFYDLNLMALHYGAPNRINMLTLAHELQHSVQDINGLIAECPQYETDAFRVEVLAAEHVLPPELISSIKEDAKHITITYDEAYQSAIDIDVSNKGTSKTGVILRRIAPENKEYDYLSDIVRRLLITYKVRLDKPDQESQIMQNFYQKNYCE